MTDLIDQAQHFEAINLAQSLLVRQRRAATLTRPAAQGHCLNLDCLEPFDGEPERLFCGPACAQAHERRDQFERGRGRR